MTEKEKEIDLEVDGLDEIFKEAEASVDKIAGKTEVVEEIPIDTIEDEADKSDEAEKGDETAELKEKLLRSLADFQNYRQRMAKEKVSLIETTQKETLLEILPVVDNFERAFEAKGDPENILQGLQMVYKQLLNVLKNLNLKVINDKGEMFDPMKHDAFEHAESKDMPAGTILRVEQKGYFLGDKLIRPVKVVVAKAPTENAGQPTGGSEDGR